MEWGARRSRRLGSWERPISLRFGSDWPQKVPARYVWAWRIKIRFVILNPCSGCKYCYFNELRGGSETVAGYAVDAMVEISGASCCCEEGYGNWDGCVTVQRKHHNCTTNHHGLHHCEP